MNKIIITKRIILFTFLFIQILIVVNASNIDDDIDEILSSNLAISEKVQVAGAIFKVYEGGNVRSVYSRKFIENQTGTGDYKVHLASMSKHFTGAAIAYLENKKLLELEDKVSKYISDWPDYASDIKIKHLLNHSSGLQDYTQICKRKTSYKAKKVITKFINKKNNLYFPPGSDYDYSNTGYVVLARIVEEISGYDFPDFMNDTFFSELGMNNTSLRYYNDDKPSNVLRTYKIDGKSKYCQTICDWIGGDGGIYTNIEDLSKWSIFLSGKSSMGETIPDKIFNSSGDAVNYGYGIYINKSFRGQTYHYHKGSWNGSKTGFMFFPERSEMVVVLSNGKAFDDQKGVMKDMMGVYFDYMEVGPCYQDLYISNITNIGTVRKSFSKEGMISKDNNFTGTFSVEVTNPNECYSSAAFFLEGPSETTLAFGGKLVSPIAPEEIIAKEFPIEIKANEDGSFPLTTLKWNMFLWDSEKSELEDNVESTYSISLGPDYTASISYNELYHRNDSSEVTTGIIKCLAKNIGNAPLGATSKIVIIVNEEVVESKMIESLSDGETYSLKYKIKYNENLLHTLGEGLKVGCIVDHGDQFEELRENNNKKGLILIEGK